MHQLEDGWWMVDSQRVAIVTGGTRGLGRSIAKMLAADGYTVVVNYRSSESWIAFRCSALGSRTMLHTWCRFSAQTKHPTSRDSCSLSMAAIPWASAVRGSRE
ncbi:SDR family NAD(P)-dependent oxidoreductase [Alicyclobacillus cycloheptanicus]|nr:SDR family NAD(P)-dependent oxidoreductase [Alicyclobacillus cycloheptanicus]